MPAGVGVKAMKGGVGLGGELSWGSSGAGGGEASEGGNKDVTSAQLGPARCA